MINIIKIYSYLLSHNWVKLFLKSHLISCYSTILKTLICPKLSVFQNYGNIYFLFFMGRLWLDFKLGTSIWYVCNYKKHLLIKKTLQKRIELHIQLKSKGKDVQGGQKSKLTKNLTMPLMNSPFTNTFRQVH